MAIDHGSGVSAPTSDPVFLHVKSGMTVIVTDTDGAWRMADVIWVDASNAGVLRENQHFYQFVDDPHSTAVD